MGGFDFTGPSCKMVEGFPNIWWICRIEVSLTARADGNAETSELVYHVANLYSFTAEYAFESLAFNCIVPTHMLIFHVFFKSCHYFSSFHFPERAADCSTAHGYCVLLVQIFHAGFMVFHLTKSTFFFELLSFGFPGSVPFVTLAVINGVDDGADDPEQCQENIKAEKQDAENGCNIHLRHLH
nr:MAG TPA: hypothetical protein [Caudoviricetes sp.]